MTFSPDPLHNIENLKAKNKTKSVSIYLLVVLTLITFLCFLPIIFVDISNQSRGVVRASQDTININTIISGKLTRLNFLLRRFLSNKK